MKNKAKKPTRRSTPNVRSKKPSIGFIGQGYIGKNYADDFDRRGFFVTRYALEPEYAGNKDRIRTCDIVFIAVPTPTVPGENGKIRFDDSIVRSAVNLVGKGKIAVIKSTILPGTTESIQEEHPDIFVLHSPEFLTEVTAAFDAAHPKRNIIGIPKDSAVFRLKAKAVLAVLPKAPFELIASAREAEIVKYAGNGLLYLKTVFVNVLYDLTGKIGADWGTIKKAIAADPRLGSSHLNPIHASGRGAGGHCFIKDFAALAQFFDATVEDPKGAAMLRAIEDKNIELLVLSGKDRDLLKGVYGETINRNSKNKPT